MSQKERWASRVGLVLAMAGNAVGLGNFLRFPAQAVQNGGGAFIIPYIAALLIMGLPLMWIEWTMGRFGGSHGHHSGPGILHSMGRTPWWKYFGIFGLWTNLIVAAFYVYIESWTFAYAINSIMGGFTEGDPSKYFSYLIGQDPDGPPSIISLSFLGMGVFFLCIMINVYVLSRGLAKGIEIVAKIAMPLLIGFAVLLAIRGLMIIPGTEEGGDPKAITSPFEGLNYLWQPQYESLANPTVWLAAAGQVFFTLSIGLGSILCYSSYLRPDDDVALTGATTAWTNEFCEIVLGGTILIPIAVAYFGIQGMEDKLEGGGLNLAFVTFPTLINNWGPLAPYAGFLWFGLLFFAAVTSSLAMGQPIMAFLQDEFQLSRPASALAFGGLLTVLAVPVAIFHIDTFFAEFDYWAGTFFLVVFAIIEVILFAWVFGMGRGWAELNRGADLKVPGIFYYLIKYVTPVFLLIILVGSVLQPEGMVRETDSETGEEVRVARGWEPYVMSLFGNGEAPEWEWDGGGMIGKLLHKDLPLAEGATADEARFNNELKRVRTIDRFVLLSVFAFFAVLVFRAWNRRKAEGTV